MKLSSFLFEETTEKSNEETIANVVLGREQSTDPEDLEYDVEKQGLEDFEADTIGDDKLFEVKKRTIKKLSETQKDFFNNILAKQDIFELQKLEKGFYRVNPKDDIKKQLANKIISKEKFEEILSDAKEKMFADLEKNVIRVGEKGSGSSKYLTYLVRNKDDITISIVFAAGGNKGHDFEAQVEYELKIRRGHNWQNLICFLLQKGLITSIDDFSGYKMVDKGQIVRRPLVNITTDVGEKISDLTLNVDAGRKIYVSLKGDIGKTFANLGAGGSFISTVDQDPNTGKEICKVTIGDNPKLFNFLNDAGVDPELIRAGYEAYGNGLLGNNPDYKQKTGITNPQVMDWLNASLGYGYIYFRRTPSGGYRIFNLDTPDAIKNVTGEFVSGVITYPYYINNHKSSKQCTIKVTTTTADYDIELRSTAGGDAGNVTAENFINSLQCNVRVVKINLAGSKDFQIDPKCENYIDWYFHTSKQPIDESFRKLGKLNLSNLLF